MTAPLRAVFLYSAGHLGSSIALNILHRMPELRIVGAVRAEPAALKSFTKTWKKFSVIGWQFAWLMCWQRVVQFIAFYAIAPLLKHEHWMAAWQLTDRYGIPSHQTANINQEETLQFVRSHSPDLLISAYFSQILKKPILQLPRLGALNIHPGLLPDYKGAMNYFWVLKNEENRAGVSVHWMDEGVDTGAVLARRSFLLKREATQQQVLAQTAIIGARLLQRVVRNLSHGLTPESLPPVANEGRYYPLPGAAEFTEYFKRRRFFRIRDTLRFAMRRSRPHVR